MLFYCRYVAVTDTGRPRGVTQRRHRSKLAKTRIPEYFMLNLADDGPTLVYRRLQTEWSASHKTHARLILTAS